MSILFQAAILKKGASNNDKTERTFVDADNEDI